MPEFIDIPSPSWPLTFGTPGNPSVVVVHDSFGRLPYLESYAQALANRDFYVVVPDLFNGLATIDSEGADELRSAIDIGFALATLEDAVELGHLGREPQQRYVLLGEDAVVDAIVVGAHQRA